VGLLDDRAGVVDGVLEVSGVTVRDSSDGRAVVDTEYFWRPINTCPAGRKVQLINKALGCAAYGTHNPKNKFWTHWAPLPKFKVCE
jgi:hypothetical protein